MPVSEQLRVAVADRYRVEREIGAGGMATVYLAQDLKHHRKVALKVLRPELAAVLGTERFLSEINVTANLQHPHLLPLFDSGEADGLLFYVMPFVEGESLRHRLERERQLPVDEAIQIATAVASALAYAHRHDVIHRDLKPENILLHEGQPLVTDFGIALAVRNAGGGRITQTGLSLGTPQYMSPEQATGDRAIDARSDIYSLGAVLYEMLVGDPPHMAGTTQGIIAKVLTERAPSVRVYRDTVPEHIDAAVQCALAKLPADRFTTAREFAEALLGTRAVTLPKTTSVRTDAPKSDTPLYRRRLTALLPWGVAAAAVLATGIRTIISPVAPPAGWPTRFEVTFADSVELRTPLGVTIALSRDGAHLAFTGARRGSEGIFLRRLDGLGAQLVRGTEGGSHPSFSPDGSELAFFVVGEGTVRKVPISGGAPITLVDSASGVGSWSDSGDYLFVHRRAIRRVPAAGGEPVVLAELDTARDHRRYGWLHALPGGKAALLTVWKGGFDLPSAELAVVSIPEGKLTELGVIGTGPRYLPRERVVIFGREDGSILAAGFSLRTLRFTGPPVPVLDNVIVRLGGAVELAVSDNGTVIYKAGEAPSGLLAVVDRTGAETQTVFLQPFATPRVSPDGRRIAVAASAATGRDIWQHDLTTHTTSRVTSAAVSSQVARRLHPEWLDAERIVYATVESGRAPRLEVQRWDASSNPESFASAEGGGLVQIAPGPPGGYHILRFSKAAGAAADLFIAPVDSPQGFRPLFETPEDEQMPSLSPDGRLLAYVSDQTGRREVYIRPVPGVGPRIQVSIGGGEEPVWAASGRELLYRGRGWFRTVTITTEPALDIARRDSLFADVYARQPGDTNFDVFPNGDLAVVRTSFSTSPQLVGITNWRAVAGK